MVAQQNDLSTYVLAFSDCFPFPCDSNISSISSLAAPKKGTRGSYPFFSLFFFFFVFKQTLCINFISGSIRLALPVWKESAYPQEGQRQVTVRVKVVDDIDYT